MYAIFIQNKIPCKSCSVNSYNIHLRILCVSYCERFNQKSTLRFQVVALLCPSGYVELHLAGRSILNVIINENKMRHTEKVLYSESNR